MCLVRASRGARRAVLAHAGGRGRGFAGPNGAGVALETYSIGAEHGELVTAEYGLMAQSTPHLGAVLHNAEVMGAELRGGGGPVGRRAGGRASAGRVARLRGRRPESRCGLKAITRKASVRPRLG